MTRPRRRGESGQTIAFVVGITLALLLLIGLTVDGGRILSARERALDEAQEAARVGAQQLDQAALHTRGMDILSLVGIGTVTISETGIAHAAQGTVAGR